MSIHKPTDFDSTTATRLSHDGSDAAELIVWQIEDLSRSSDENCRAMLKQGRNLLNRLAVTCRGRPALLPTFKRGKLAMQLLLDRHHEALRADKAERDRISSERAVAIVQRNSQYLHVASQKKRIIAILETAARTTDPASFAPHIRQCKQIWLGLGIAGSENLKLANAYRDAAAAYWNAVKSTSARSADANASIDRRARLLKVLAWYWRTTCEVTRGRSAQKQIQT